jgi:hypothetical protein
VKWLRNTDLRSGKPLPLVKLNKDYVVRRRSCKHESDFQLQIAKSVLGCNPKQISVKPAFH